MKRMGIIITSVLVVLVVAAYFFVSSGVNKSINAYYFGKSASILELKDVGQFTLFVKGTGSDRVLEISGLDMNSSFVVDKLYKEQKGTVLQLKVSHVLTHKGASGSFTYSVPIPEDSIKEVSFGNNNAQIWPVTVPHKESSIKKIDATLAPSSMKGKYVAEKGAGNIQVSPVDSTHVYISGSTILAGPGNAATPEATQAHTGKIVGKILIQGNEGTFRADPLDAECTLTLTFISGKLVVSGGYDSCDATIANFDGTYIKL